MQSEEGSGEVGGCPRELCNIAALERDEVRGKMGPYRPSEDFDAYTLSAMGSI